METPEKEIVFVQKEGDFHPKIHIFWEIWQKLFTKQKKMYDGVHISPKSFQKINIYRHKKLRYFALF